MEPPNDGQSITSGKKACRRITTIELSKNLECLENLLNIHQLKRELLNLTEGSGAWKPKSYFDNSDTRTMVSTWTNHNHIHSMLGSYASIFSEQQCSLTGIMLCRMLHSICILPSLASDSQKLALILRAQNWEMCRSLMVVFNWCRDDGPTTAKHLLDVYRTRGYDQLKKESPLLADFVNHIVWYVYMEQKGSLKEKRESRSRKRSKNINGSYTIQPPQNSEEETSNFGPYPDNVTDLPNNLYGLSPSAKTLSKQAIKLSQAVLTQKKIGGGINELYARSSELLQKIWINELIIPSLKPIDNILSTTRCSTKDTEDILNRALTRGAILQCLAEACGTDAIFASSAVKKFLESPSLVFCENMHRSKVFARHALGDAVTTLEPLFNWIKEYIKATPEILEVAKEIGNLTHCNMLELGAGHPLSQKQTENTISFHALQSGTTSTKEGQRVVNPKKRHIFSKVSSASLLPDSMVVGIGVMGLIVREALTASADRNLSTTVEILQRVLQGKRHATQSSSSFHNPDHTNPIRQHSFGAKLLYLHLPGNKLRSEAGLSNLLSWLGTGQGFVTQSFLKKLETHGGFYKEDLTDMARQFNDAIVNSLNQYCNTNSSSNSTSQHPEAIVTYDSNIWGQASNHLALMPTYRSGAKIGKKYTILEKFGQYFTQEVQKRWTESLGDMLNKDPSTYTGQKHPWKYYHSMIKEFNIPGFKQGLTVFQTANYLVFLNIATMPHWSKIANFIHENRLKGAFRGLNKLGFHMPDASSVQVAFYSVHHHLDKYLTEDDKEILGFSPIFTEHLLCKVVRWANSLDKEANIDFYKMGSEAELICTLDSWKSGFNRTDNAAFPFPLTITAEQLAKNIKELESFGQSISKTAL